ncbi:MAG: ornithine carbamoyltransferase [Planctomycetota bacterium]|nr:ornithine carbamoyltransferase [Planctomycetota bacterium]
MTISPPPTRAIGSRGLARVLDLSSIEIESILSLAERLRLEGYGAFSESMRGKSLALVFEKPSLRTRVSFEVGFQKLGGSVIFLDQQASPLGSRETLPDFGHNIERWIDVVAARVMSHSTILELSNAMSIPVINALCDRHHPCQALADYQTLASIVPSLRESHLAWVGDGNNVCHSLIECASAVGGRITVVTPKECTPSPAICADAQGRAMRTGANLTFSNDLAAIEGADAVYTDVWVSMGDTEGDRKIELLSPYQVNSRVMQIAGPRAKFMHCLPAKRGIEVTDEVIDSPQSIVFDQAENRMHAQAALLLSLLQHS